MRTVAQPFSLQHLPYGLVDFGESSPHLAVRLDDQAISLEILRRGGTLPDFANQSWEAGSLGVLLSLSPQAHRELRDQLRELLQSGRHRQISQATLDLAPYPLDDPRVLKPIEPGDFVDFYCSRHHAYRVGCLFRSPAEALPSQYFHLPIGYHGRCSTLQASGLSVQRPCGITAGPAFGPTRRLDYELELAFLLRACDAPQTPDQAANLIFGVLLLNDWSARDIQAYEYKPLGPFLGKSFATSIASWVTPWEALEPWRRCNTDSDHQVLPHLQELGSHHLELPLWALLDSEDGSAELCHTNLKHLAWSAAQMIAHLTSNGTRIRTGDLIASGTVSGPDPGSEACLLERTEGGKKPLQLTSGQRHFLQDSDTVTLLGGHPGVGLAPCRATIASP